MKSIIEYIKEQRNVDVICIYDTKNKPVEPVKYAFDSDSLDEFLKYYEKNEQYFIGKTLSLCKQQGNKWVLCPGEGNLDLIKPNDKTYYHQGNIMMDYHDLHQKLDDGEYILILMKEQ